MATKNTETVQQTQVAAQGDSTTTSSSAPASRVMPALGSTCNVRVAAGIVLMNNETGIRFEPEKDTPVTVTITLLRRLQDGDLTLVG